jgi:hypothetical protein
MLTRISNMRGITTVSGSVRLQSQNTLASTLDVRDLFPRDRECQCHFSCRMPLSRIITALQKKLTHLFRRRNAEHNRMLFPDEHLILLVDDNKCKIEWVSVLPLSETGPPDRSYIRTSIRMPRPWKCLGNAALAGT